MNIKVIWKDLPGWANGMMQNEGWIILHQDIITRVRDERNLAILSTTGDVLFNQEIRPLKRIGLHTTIESTDTEDSDKPPFMEVWPPIEKLFSPHPQVITYDMGDAYLAFGVREQVHNIRLPAITWIDLSKSYSLYWRKKISDYQNIFTACEQQGVQIEKRRGAVAKAEAIYKLIQALASNNSSKGE